MSGFLEALHLAPTAASNERTRRKAQELTAFVRDDGEAAKAGPVDAVVEALRDVPLQEAERVLVDFLEHQPKRELMLAFRDGRLFKATAGESKKEYDGKASAPLPELAGGESFAGSVLTHTHPDGSPLSRGDVMLAVKNNLLEIRATGRFGTYALRRSGDDWGKASVGEVFSAYAGGGAQAWAKMADERVPDELKKAARPRKGAATEDDAARSAPLGDRSAGLQAPTARGGATKPKATELRPKAQGGNKAGATFAEDLCMVEHYACLTLAAKFGLSYMHPDEAQLVGSRVALYEVRDAAADDKRAGMQYDL